MWQPIETAPKAGYVLITDGVCMPDVAVWFDERKARTDAHGTYHHAIPEGWFNVARSRIRDPQWWMPLPELPK